MITGFLWLEAVVEKLERKHRLDAAEVEAVFARRPSVSRMARKPDPLPETMSIAEASEFWDTHSVADYPTQVVEMEFDPQGRSTLVAVEDGLLQRLKTQARKTGVSVETLVNLWLEERLASAS